MCILLKNNPAIFHPDPIWYDGTLGFLEERRPDNNKKKNNNSIIIINNNNSNNNNKNNKMSIDMGSVPPDPSISLRCRCCHLSLFAIDQLS